MHRFGDETVLATYRVRPGAEAAFESLLARHGALLRRLGLTNGEPALPFRGQDAEGKTFYVELFTWRDRAAVDAAHGHPEVAALWGAMERHVEARGGRPPWEFPHVRPISLPSV